MPEKLSEFLKDVASAKAKGDAADAEIIAKLKSLSPEDFARVPREILGGLSNAQYADVVGSIAPDIELKVPKMPPVISPSPRRRFLRVANLVSWIPRLFVALGTALSAGAIILLIGINAGPLIDWWSYSQPLFRSIEAQDWPSCPHLDRWTDGCVYQVAQGISWRDAARDLELPESYLRQLNRHIVGNPVPAAARLIVWRERFPLGKVR